MAIPTETAPEANTNERYFDIGNVDTVPRLPIDGYQDKPLVSQFLVCQSTDIKINHSFH